MKFSIYLNRRVFVMAQADLGLCSVHVSDGTFSHVATNFFSYSNLHVTPNKVSDRFLFITSRVRLKFSADNVLKYLSYFPKKTGSAISCKLSL